MINAIVDHDVHVIYNGIREHTGDKTVHDELHRHPRDRKGGNMG